MENSDSPATPETALAKIVVPEVVDFEVIQTSILPSINGIVDRADGIVAKIAAEVKDEASMTIAVREADYLRDNGKDLLQKWREEHYMDVYYRPGEERRKLFDTPLTRINAHIKTLMNAVADCKERMKREARLAKERAEAEAKRQREEAERKQREAEAAERLAKEAAENEKRRKEEAIAAEARRVQAEKDAQERRDREAREAAAAETQRKMREEEEARIKHAEVAQEVGNSDKIDSILDTQRPISGVLGKAEQAPDLEAVRLEQENARRVTEERAKREAEEAAEAERKRKDAEAAAFRAKEEAALAAQAAAAASAAAAAVPEKVINSETTSVERKKWDLESDGTEAGDEDAVRAILKAILDGVYPIEYCGYNKKRPQDWRPSQIQTDITNKDKRFLGGPGIRVYTQVDEQQKRRPVGGRR
jgi:hypothetical protein